MRFEVFDTDDEVAIAAARHVAGVVGAAIDARGACAMALSGGRTPWEMLERLRSESVAWSRLHVFQVDERLAPAGSDDRNLTRLEAILVDGGPLPAACLHPMPVEARDPDAAAADYAESLRTFAGTPPVLDLVHLGLGEDGHTASLVPGDPVLEVADADVAMCGTYRGHRRMTLTRPIIDRARERMWVATGAAKIEMLARLRRGDETIPAGTIEARDAIVFADAAAAGPARDTDYG